MKTIIAIVGLSGAGKDTCADYLAQSKGWNKIISYTTRPKRPDETDNYHIFVDKFDRMEKPFAYLEYGGYEYWTMFSQFLDDVPNVYVIDETSLCKLLRAQEIVEQIYEDAASVQGINDSVLSRIEEQRFKVISVLINRKDISVCTERTARDDGRSLSLNSRSWDYVIENNGTISELYHSLDEMTLL